MARKAFVVNEVMREKVRYLAGVGVRQDDIAKIIGCAPKTLRKRAAMTSIAAWRRPMRQMSGYLFAAAKARQCRGADLLAEDAGALAGEADAGRPGSGQRRRGEFTGGPGPARQQPRSRADAGAARRTREILCPKTQRR